MDKNNDNRKLMIKHIDNASYRIVLPHDDQLEVKVGWQCFNLYTEVSGHEFTDTLSCEQL